MLDFYLYCLRFHPGLMKFAFAVLFNLARYKMCRISESEFEALARKYASEAVRMCPDAENLAQRFWKSHAKRFNLFYKDVKRADDVAVSAGFGFLLSPAFEILGVKRYVCSEIDLETGEITRICFGKNKVKCFAESFCREQVEDFYTDSMNDLPFMKLARNDVYMVKRGVPREISNQIRAKGFD